MNSMVLFVVFAIAAYFIGNISPARLMGKVYGVDISKEGSGNPGTTNVLRVLGKKAAAITLIVDVLKGFIPTFAALLAGLSLIGMENAGTIVKLVLLTSFCVFMGHCFPVLFKFKGGKGIATTFGIVLAIRPHCALILLAIVIVVVLITRYVSLGSVVGAIVFPQTMIVMNSSYNVVGAVYAVWAVLMAIIVFIKHWPNIKRLISGEESKIRFNKSAQPAYKEDTASYDGEVIEAEAELVDDEACASGADDTMSEAEIAEEEEH